MEQHEEKRQPGGQLGEVKATPLIPPLPEKHTETQSPPQEESEPGKGSCAVCPGAPNYVYALGNIEVRFPNVSVEKEFVQATARTKTAGMTDQQVLRTVLSEPQNRYLVRQACWVLKIEGVETYILQPRHPEGLELLVEAIRPDPRPTDIDLVIGARGPIAPPEMCNGLMIPIVGFDQIYSFDMDSLIKSIPRPKGIATKKFEDTALELLMRIKQTADNAGATDEHRALNYLLVRDNKIYECCVECHGRNCSLTGVEVRPSPLSGVRKIFDVIFSYTNRATDVTEKYFVRVDVTEEFPFLVTKLSPYTTVEPKL